MYETENAVRSGESLPALCRLHRGSSLLTDQGITLISAIPQSEAYGKRWSIQTLNP